MRGTRGGAGNGGTESRFIPACAGNTDILERNRFIERVHPRVCGEHVALANAVHMAFGSSPRVRGTQRQRRVAPCRLRFIPACAGNTNRCHHPEWKAPVHPRVYGEHTHCITPCLHCVGSSPRVRGTHSVTCHVWPLTRFIPACTGNTPLLGCAAKGSPVHPRVYGEHILYQCVLSCGRGSSPRVRGTRTRCRPSHTAARFIPACTGNTSAVSPVTSGVTVHPRVYGEHEYRPKM